MLKLLQHCYQCLKLLRNYFDGPTKLFSDLYLIKFFNISAKLCTFYENKTNKYFENKLKNVKKIYMYI